MPEAKEEILYPTWRYHKTEEARVVHSAEQDAELGKGWSDKPFPEAAEKAEGEQFLSEDALAEQKAAKKKK